MKTELKDRVLWFDGTSSGLPTRIPELVLQGIPTDRLAVTELNDDVAQYNALADSPIPVKVANLPFDHSWQVPRSYLEVDLIEHVGLLLAGRGPEYLVRAEQELVEISRRGLEPLFQTLIYVVDSFREAGTVWGVGRGSSCASLVLFLIGLHLVDPVLHDIPMSEFFHGGD